MEHTLYYELEENGYHIKDKANPYLHIHQYNPYLIYEGTYEEQAKKHINDLIKNEIGLIKRKPTELDELKSDIVKLKMAIAEDINKDIDSKLPELVDNVIVEEPDLSELDDIVEKIGIIDLGDIEPSVLGNF